MIRIQWPLAALTLACAGGAFAALPTYSVAPLPLGDAPSDTGFYSSANAINNAGQVAANRGQSGSGALAYRCSSTACQGVPLLPGGHHGTVGAAAIGKGGVVVGANPQERPYSLAYKWDGKTVTTYEPPKGDCPWCELSTVAHAINKEGRMAGMAQDPHLGDLAATFELDGTIVKLPSLGGEWAYANDINDDGIVVGTGKRVGGSYRGFVYDGNQLTELGTLGGTSSDAKAVNLARQIVGCSQTAGDAGWQSFIYQQTMTPIPKLGTGSACAWDINRHGQVVGYENVSGSVYVGTLFMHGKIVDLNQRLTPADREVWQITAANAINAHGEIAANATHKVYGTRRGVVLKPVAQ
jgi:probable HAF family extracellular repeat protein